MVGLRDPELARRLLSVNSSARLNFLVRFRQGNLHYLVRRSYALLYSGIRRLYQFNGAIVRLGAQTKAWDQSWLIYQEACVGRECHELLFRFFRLDALEGHRLRLWYRFTRKDCGRRRRRGHGGRIEG